MAQVTTGATLLSVDVRFPEVHELPRDEGPFRAKFVELKEMSAVRPRPRARDGKTAAQWSCAAAICLFSVHSLAFAPLPASSEDWRVGASRGQTGWSLSPF